MAQRWFSDDELYGPEGGASPTRRTPGATGARTSTGRAVTAEPPDAAGLRSALRDALGSDPGEASVAPVPGGASRESWSIESDRGRWFLRRDPPAGGSFLPLELEHRILAEVAERGVPVPRPLAFEPVGGAFGTAGLLMEHVAGTSVAPQVLRRDGLERARGRLPVQLAEALARIHSVDPADLDGVAGGSDPALDACGHWEAALDDIGEPLPGVEAGLRWLRLNRPPPPPRLALVHGDFRLGNLIVDEDGLAAVIDWELCHAGDPAEDIGWLCIRSWRFGNDRLPVAGLGELEPFLAAYEAAGGERPSSERLRWWEAMGNVKWAVICARQAHDHLTGARPSAELASLGRRICEPEWDLLNLLAEKAG
jgi:aminoglycoside phosphotransferase (APT) family kinase protein